MSRAHAVALTASVEQGRLRLYFADGDGFPWAEAAPGAPLRPSGRLIAETGGYLFNAESVGGPSGWRGPSAAPRDDGVVAEAMNPRTNASALRPGCGR